jgi:Fe2+ or Zn2+ uptake regulation protein
MELTKKVLKLYSSFTALPNHISAELLYDEINKSDPKVTRHYVTRLIERLDSEIL